MNYANRLVENGVTIFLFHGVEDGVCTEVRNYTRKHIPKTDFCTYLEELKVCGTPVSMDDVVADRRGERPLPPYAFTITFDDGFENNLSVAAPVLAETPPNMLVIANRIDDIKTFDPAESFEFAGADVSRNVYEKLVNFDPLDLDAGSMTVYKNDERLGVMQESGLTGEYVWAAQFESGTVRIAGHSQGADDFDPAFTEACLKWKVKSLRERDAIPAAEAIELRDWLFSLEAARVLRPGGRAVLVWRNGAALIHRLAHACLCVIDRLRGLPEFPQFVHSIEDLRSYLTVDPSRAQAW